MMTFLLQYQREHLFRFPSHTEKADRTMDRLRSLILTHWQNYHPTMVEEFKKENRLEAELEETANQFSDLLHELTVVKKMSSPSAWEIAVNQFLLPEEEESSSNEDQSNRDPATFEY